MGLVDWLFSKIKISPATTPVKTGIETLVSEVRQEMADCLGSVDFGTVDLSPETLAEIRREVSITLSKGANWKGCKAKNFMPEFFRWDEYDEWLSNISKLRNPPGLFNYHSKQVMYQSVLISQAVERQKLETWESRGTTRVKLQCSPDSCSLCKKTRKVWPIGEVPMIGKGRHPGCRCGLLPLD